MTAVTLEEAQSISPSDVLVWEHYPGEGAEIVTIVAGWSTTLTSSYFRSVLVYRRIGSTRVVDIRHLRHLRQATARDLMLADEKGFLP